MMPVNWKTAAILAIVTMLSGACSGKRESSEHYDVLIVDGMVYDGSDSPARQVNIGIVGDRITSVGASADATAGQVINAAGLTVMPGFIDPHTHALGDLKNPETRGNVNYLAQGVTTVVVGNDGDGVPELEQTLQRMRDQGIGTNVAFFAGHGDIRNLVMGLENRHASAAELSAMQDILEQQMRQGALGLSTGLYYTPGSFANTSEVLALAGVVARYQGVYDSHIRQEGSGGEGLKAAVEEVITIAESAGLPGHIAHLKALGKDVWGQSADIIAMVEAARARGVDITADQYPYRASGTRFSSALVPDWVRADSREAMFQRFDSPGLSAQIHEEMAANIWRRGGPDSLLVTGSGSPWRGMTLAEIAKKMDLDPVDAAIAVVSDGDPSVASFNMNPSDIRAFASTDWMMTGSDGSAGHPRKYGTYPTVFRDMVQEQGLFSVQRFVHRSSGKVADFTGLCDRGYLEVGRKADIVVIDLDNYRALADFENPTGLATGVVHALVGGRAVIAEGLVTEDLPGEVINRLQLDCPKLIG